MISRIEKKVLSSFPYVKTLKKEVSDLREACGFPPGHYYSPIVDPVDYYEQQETENAGDNYMPPEIDFNEHRQTDLLESFRKFKNEFPFSADAGTGARYYYNNDFFTYVDALSMYYMLRLGMPKRIIEIGSGFSSALILDVSDKFFNGSVSLTFIDPNPERLESLIRASENITLIKDKIQHVNRETFSQLEEGDFLLIDTSHVSKSGSDVNHIFFNILPYIKKGVKVHIHDIFFPFEYPEKWVVNEKRGWNEIFLLRAFLSYNSHFRMIHFNSFLQKKYPDQFSELFPLAMHHKYKAAGGIWLEKIA